MNQGPRLTPAGPFTGLKSLASERPKRHCKRQCVVTAEHELCLPRDRTIAWIRTLPAGPERRELERWVPGLLYESGRSREARELAEADYATHPTELEARELVAFIAAELGDTAVARRFDEMILADCSKPARCPADYIITRAAIAAHLGYRDASVQLIRDAIRAGWMWRSALHFIRAFDSLRGYPPYDELAEPRRDERVTDWASSSRP